MARAPGKGRQTAIRPWVALALWFVAAAVIGCAVSPDGPLGELPVHWLGLTVGGRGDAGRAGGAAPEPQWQPAKGQRLWRYVVIHHSATPGGSAASFDEAHRAKGWDGLGYHFVIDNGDGGPDGQVEVGHRWRIQKWGAHTGAAPNNEYNDHGIGVCLVGDFTNSQPTAAQIASLKRLVTYLALTYDIPPENVIGHCDAPGASTECPGPALHKYIHQKLRPGLAAR